MSHFISIFSIQKTYILLTLSFFQPKFYVNIPYKRTFFKYTKIQQLPLYIFYLKLNDLEIPNPKDSAT